MAGLPFLNAFKKNANKIANVGVGIKSVERWLSTNNYSLNRALSGDYLRGIPEGRITMFAGPSGSGKSFITGNIALTAQRDHDMTIFIIDTENAIDIDYLAKIGVDTSEDKLLYMQATTIEDVNKLLSDFFDNYQKAYGKDNMDAPRTLLILDSLGGLASSTEIENYEKSGVIKGDQGQLAKRKKALLKLATNYLARLPITMLVTDHTYVCDPIANFGESISVSPAARYACSIVGLISKLKLKEGTDVIGVRMRFDTYKSRFAKIGTRVELEIPYSSGMSPFSGLVDMLEAEKVIAKGTQVGEKLLWVCEYTDTDGNSVRVAFKEKELTNEIVQKLIKHPNALPMLARDEPEIDLKELDESAE